MLTVHILTKNNQKTIEATLKSVADLGASILVGDYASTDNTIEICKTYHAKIFNVKNKKRNEARTWLDGQASKNGWNLWLEPWETIIQNPLAYESVNSDTAYVRVLHEQNITWDVRLWHKSCQFINPVFETIKSDNASNSNMILASSGGHDYSDVFESIQQWKVDEPLSKQPYYYQACLLLAEKRYDDFLASAEHYLFLDKQPTTSGIMTRYYYAMVQLMHKKAVKPTLQNLNLCLCAKPLMAEFWCLTGDVYYHLMHKFALAKEFYENAIFLGSKRLASDRWPMDISKYNKYPNKMIESCNQLLNNHADFVPKTQYKISR